MTRSWYPRDLRTVPALTLLRLALLAWVRSWAPRLRSPANAVATALLAAGAVFGFVQTLRMTGRAGIPDHVIFGAAAAVAVWTGARAWARHLASRPEDSPWIALGGHPRARTLRAMASFLFASLVLTIWALFAARGRAGLLDAGGWWAAETAAWAAICVGLSAARASGLAVTHRLAGRVREAPVAPAPRTGLSPAAIGARLTVRAIGPQAAQALAFVTLVGVAILPGVHDIEGPGPAAAFGGLTLLALLLTLAAACRSRVGTQHAFLLLHERQVPRKTWRGLVAGEALVLAVVAAVAFAAVALPTPAWRTAGVAVAGGIVVEWAACLAIAAHAWAGRNGRDEAARTLLLHATGIGLLLAVVLKDAAVASATSRWVVLPAAAFWLAFALRFAGRAPFRLGGAGPGSA